MCELPKWTTGEYFDSYHKGLIGSDTNDTLNADFVEHVLDNCRYFAEACDHLSTIEIVTEHVGGLAGLTTSLLQSIREEYGNSICIPVWSLSNRPAQEEEVHLKYDGASLMDSISTMKNRVSVLDSALFYNRSIEHCNVLIPISLQSIISSIYYRGGKDATSAVNVQYDTYLSTAVAAAVIETASVYNTHPVVYSAEDDAEAHHQQQQQQYAEQQREHSVQSADMRKRQRQSNQSSNASSAQGYDLRVDNAHQWCALATQRGRLPMCFAEASFPGILHSEESEYPSGGGRGGGDNGGNGYDGLEQYLIDSFDSKRLNWRANNNNSRMQLPDTVTCNPFTVALSPVPPVAAERSDSVCSNRGVSSTDGSRDANSSSFPYHKAYTNLLSVRGSSSEGE